MNRLRPTTTCFNGTRYLVVEVIGEKIIIKEKLSVMMLCPECSVVRKKDDFLGRNTCYKCQYKKKLDKLKPQEIRCCGNCGRRFLRSNRWIYCSGECQQRAEMQQKKQYWTNHVAKR